MLESVDKINEIVLQPKLFPSWRAIEMPILLPPTQELERPTAIHLLAGGQSRRMGQNKADLMLGPLPLAQWSLRSAESPQSRRSDHGSEDRRSGQSATGRDGNRHACHTSPHSSFLNVRHALCELQDHGGLNERFLSASKNRLHAVQGAIWVFPWPCPILRSQG